jgi:hypothetical protein
MGIIGSIALRMSANPAPLKRDLKQSASAVQTFSAQVASTSTLIKGAFAAAVGGVAVMSIKKMVTAGSDLSENVGKIGAIFGDQSKSVEGDARKMADAFGVSLNGMLDGAGKLGGLFKGAGFTADATADLSKQFNRLTLDASRFFNVDYDTAFQKIRSGLAGEAEPLRDFGVFLTADKIKAEALAMGLGGLNGELTDTAKITATAALIQRGLADAHGNAAATASGAAARMEEFAGRVENLAATLGESLAPIAGQVLGDLSVGVAAMTSAWNESGAAVVKWSMDTVQGTAAAGQSIGLIESSVGYLADAWQVVSHEVHLVQGVVLELFTMWVVGIAKVQSAMESIKVALGGKDSGINAVNDAQIKSYIESLDKAQAKFDAESKAPWASKVIADRLAKAREEIKVLQGGGGGGMVGPPSSLAGGGRKASGEIFGPPSSLTGGGKAKAAAENPFSRVLLAGTADAAAAILRTRFGASGKGDVAKDAKRSADSLKTVVDLQKRMVDLLANRVAGGLEFLAL